MQEVGVALPGPAPSAPPSWCCACGWWRLPRRCSGPPLAVRGAAGDLPEVGLPAGCRRRWRRVCAQRSRWKWVAGCARRRSCGLRPLWWWVAGRTRRRGCALCARWWWVAGCTRNRHLPCASGLHLPEGSYPAHGPGSIRPCDRIALPCGLAEEEVRQQRKFPGAGGWRGRLARAFVGPVAAFAALGAVMQGAVARPVAVFAALEAAAGGWRGRVTSWRMSSWCMAWLWNRRRPLWCRRN